MASTSTPTSSPTGRLAPSATLAAEGGAVTGPDRAAAIVMLAAWIAIVAGLAQVAAIAVRKWVFGGMTEQNPHVAWMAPLMLLVAFVPPALALALVARWRPRLADWRVTVWGFAFLGALNAALLSTRLDKWAILLLAAGVATQTMRWIAPREARFAAFARRSLRWLTAVVALLALATVGLPMLWERRALAALPAAPAGAPNVLLIILDTVRGQNLSLYGYARRTTPGLEALARDGVTFENAMATAPWTLPTHGSIFTGRWAHELSTAWDSPLDGTHRTIGEALAARGYHTAGFAANPFYTTREFGLARGFARFEVFPWLPGELAHAAPLVQTIANRPQLRRLTGYHDVLGRKTAPMVTHELLGWLDKKEQRPWLAFLNLYDAHDPYLPRPPFDTLFGSVAARRNDLMRNRGRQGGRMSKERFSAADGAAQMAAYDGAIAQLDHDVAALLDSLRARRLLENTVVIVTADHGESFGEHGLWEHGKTPYLEQIHAPLVISWPGRVPRGVRVSAPVSVRDIPATIMELVGGRDTAFAGGSLSRFWNGEAVEEPVLSDLAKEPAAERARRDSKRRVLSLLDARYHYLRIGTSRELLFDVASDPRESHDLAADGAQRATLARMRALTDSLRPPR